MCSLLYINDTSIKPFFKMHVPFNLAIPIQEFVLQNCWQVCAIIFANGYLLFITPELRIPERPETN